ncbi:NAD(P)H-binding protein [Halobacillus yeomjeoni]|uniref:NAD(P)H-binding protein n=1 Tax=Halobacillus yeomjeoni TaxID=311194 RepID=A0A931HVU6_9BACI|nr:NAD(P)H-binding protein [Halobacillus yeomjeoni]MBH0230313.1 NAD(P)H-binding protein [Halobacillus yeomjeoni]
MSGQRPVVALTGASGYIGGNLMKKMEGYAEVIALSRNGERRDNKKHVTWRSCDLYSLSDAEKGLQGADIAVYLVHSMMPSAKLTQGSFEDMDVILADNFAKAAKKQGVKQIIYLSGIIPKHSPQLSRHLKSRLEVERILKSYQVPVTTIRAGLIVGPKGSSFPILAKLVKRLPFMLLPKWTRTKTQPVALEDVLGALSQSVGNEELENQTVDIGGPEVMTYQTMMTKLADVMGTRPKMIHFPFLTIHLSRLWVRLVSGAPKEMVYPLIESLVHPMVVQEENTVKPISYGSVRFEEAAKNALIQEEQSRKKGGSKPSILTSIQEDVRSVQRVPIPEGKNVDWVAKHYVKWLEDVLNPWIKTTVDQKLSCQIGFVYSNTPLLELTYSYERSNTDRSLYYITGGWLTDTEKNVRGRLEFRKIPHKNQAIVAIHDYMPSLPWFFYKYTQAKAHLIIMALFRKHLEKMMNYSSEKEVGSDVASIKNA